MRNPCRTSARHPQEHLAATRRTSPDEPRNVSAVCWNAVMEQSRAPVYRLVRRPRRPGGTSERTGWSGHPDPQVLPGTRAAPPDQAQQQVVDHTGRPAAGAGRARHRQDHHDRRGGGATGSRTAASIPSGSWSSPSAARPPPSCASASRPRLRRTTREPLALTFHSYAYALVRAEFALAGEEPPRLLSGPEQLLEVRRMLRGEAPDGGRALAGAAAAPPSPPAASPRSCATSCSARPSAGWTAAGLRQLGRQPGPRRLDGRRRLPRPLRGALRPRAGPGLRLRGDRPDRRGPAGPGRRPGSASAGLRRGAGRRVPGQRPGAGVAAAWRWPATAGS